MSNKQIMKLMANHGIETHISGDQIQALELYTMAGDERCHEQWVYVTGWSEAALLRWLGY